MAYTVGALGRNPRYVRSTRTLLTMDFCPPKFISLVSSEEEPRIEAPNVDGSSPSPAAMQIGQTVKISPS